ncbi:hypothetical protein Tco_0886563 [Tanacetum coccineum]
MVTVSSVYYERVHKYSDWNRPTIYCDDDDDEDYTIGIPDNMCDVPFHDNYPPLDISKDQFEGFSDSNDDYSSSDDDSLYSKDIDYVDVSPPDFELVSLEVVEIVIPEKQDFRSKEGIPLKSIKRFLSPNEFSISFIRDPLSPVFDTLLPFSSENEDNVFNPGILASNEEKSPHLLSHRGFKASKLFHHKSPMLIHGENISILDVPFLYFYPP